MKFTPLWSKGHRTAAGSRCTEGEFADFFAGIPLAVRTGMLRLFFILGLSHALWLSSSYAVAQKAPPPPASHDRDQATKHDQTDNRPGTHFVLGLDAGVTSFERPRGAAGALFGAGGRIPGSPLRLYFITELAYTSLSRQLSGSALDRRRYGSAGAGLRLYLPILGPLRLFAGASAGTAYVDSRLETAAGRTLKETDWSPQATVSAGAQYRLHYHFSVDARAKWLFAQDPLSDLRQEMGDSDAAPWAVTAGVTWHL